ncbi:hypothetical protein SAMN04488543_0729 [Friedmanniella luteola]|uniref:ScyD/ScyE family protein n=1 Tax=Friedmanniella luteola TaxID=546871 RepID=A0A1H1MVF8_9ACTN|nr:ScyD/ScyE family protein [Friedmanniella luteola]SDR90871.1 hypothetical protein SAMN04488543_0729 [Friedmanniella luteola]
MFRRSRPVLVLAAATCAVALVATPGWADSAPAKAGTVKVVTRGLDGPRQVSANGGRLYVAESDSGEITRVNPRTGAKSVVVSGLASPQGVAKVGGKIYVATGGPAPDAPAGDARPAIMVARPGEKPTLFADLLAYELKANPDGQTQFGPDDAPLDALSNPYYVLRDRSKNGFLLVADAGANTVLKVDRKGRVSTFFVPPTQVTGACADQPNNNASGKGCDAVPTGLAYGPDGLLYVSALTSEVRGQGRVYKVDPKTGKLVYTIGGFTSPTGVAVDKKGNVYVSELLQGAPEGDDPPPPGFDPSAVGQIVKREPSSAHKRSYAQVTMPSGLLVRDGKLYASAWSIAGFLGIPAAGQVVTVSPKAFVPLRRS